jgi:hypothetical protein
LAAGANGDDTPRRAGATGFLQPFQVDCHYRLPRPEVELIHHEGFPGKLGDFPPGVVLRDFLRSLKFPTSGSH